MPTSGVNTSAVPAHMISRQFYCEGFVHHWRLQFGAFKAQLCRAGPIRSSCLNPRSGSLLLNFHNIDIMLIKPRDPSACRAFTCARVSPPPCLITRLRQCRDLRRRSGKLQREWKLLQLRTWQHSCSRRVSRRPYSPHAASDGHGDVEPITLQQSTAQQLAEQRDQLAQQMTAWLDDEWLPQAVHKDLGDAAAEARQRATNATVAACHHRT